MSMSAQQRRLPLGVLCAVAFFVISLLFLPDFSAALKAQGKQAQGKRTAASRAARRKAKAKSVKPPANSNLSSAVPVATPVDPNAVEEEWRIGGADASEAGAKEGLKGEGADMPGEAMDYFIKRRLPAGETELPMERYLEAQAAMQEMPLYSTVDNRMVASRADLKSLAPEQQRLGTWTWLGPGNIGGRTRSIIFNPQDPNVMYAGAVTGGVFKSTNAGQSWTPVTDLIAHVSVSSLAMEPNNPNVIYAGTGEGYEVGSSNGVNITGSYRGLGIYKTSDAGATWTRLPNTNTADFYYINDLVISPTTPQRIYAATSTGVWRSDDAGQTWSRVHNPGLRGGCLDLAIRTDAPTNVTTDVVLASCGTLSQARLYRNGDAGSATGTWNEVLADTGMGRTAIAFAPSNQNVAYALAVAFTGAFTNSLHAVFRSTDGGATWTARTRNTDPSKINRAILSNPAPATAIDCGIGTTDSISGQGWYDLALGIDPVDENRVWAGGIDIARSDDGGANWGIAGFAYEYTPTGGLVYGKPNQLHPDQHFITFHPQYNGTTNQQAFFGNDGGIFRSDNARAKVGTGVTGACNPANSEVRFVALNNDYGATQFYHGAVFPDGKSYFGGTQDNGSPFGTDAGGPNQWRLILSADGGYGAVDFLNPNNLYASSQGGNFRRSTDGGATFSSSTLGLAGTVSFITPLVMDPSDPKRLYTGGEPVWRTSDGMANWTQLGSIRNLSLTAGVMSAMAVAPTDANNVLIGMSDGFIIRTARALTLNALNPLSATLDRIARPRTGVVSWVAYDPTDRNIAYATYSTFGGAHVYRTANGGESWTAIDGTGTTGIPDIPAHCIVVDTSNNARLYVGTDLGVFVSIDGGATWAVENTGFANVMTESLALNTTEGVTSLYAFTHGRGAFKVVANLSGCNFTLSESGRSVAQAGSDLTVNVNVAPNGCSWRGESNVPWITLQPGATGTSNGTVGMKVTANNAIGTRIGTVAIAGRSFTVTQTGLPDSEAPTVRITTPTTLTVNTLLGAVNVAGTAADNTRVASVSWRSNRGGSGTASGTTTWSLAGLPVLIGRNELTITATDDAGNVSQPAVLIVNSTPTSVLVTVAGGGTINGDNIPALAASFSNPTGTVFFDAGGNFYFAEFSLGRVRRVSANGIITTVAGTGAPGFSGDGGLATAARLLQPIWVALDKDSNIYILDSGNQRVRRVEASTGIISTYAGTGTAGYSGDGGAATAAQINLATNGNGAIALDASGNLYIADNGNNRIRKVDATTRVITTIAGGVAGLSGDGGPAADALLRSPQGMTFDKDGNLYFADSGNARIRKIAATTNIITTYAGGGNQTGDGGQATSASFGTVFAVEIDRNGILYFADASNNRVRRVAADGIITTAAGGGATGLAPDGSAAVGASFSLLRGLGIDAQGALYIAEANNFRIRKVINGVPGDTTPPVIAITEPTTASTYTAPTGSLDLRGTASDNGTVVALRWSNDRGGSGAAFGTTLWGVNGIGLQPGLNNLTVTAWDVSGNVATTQLAVTYSANQVVTTLAGTGAIASTGDGEPGTIATLNQPRGVAVDSKGNIIVADTQNRRVRRISPSGVISAFAGTGEIGSSGDGGPATAATLNFPNVVVIDKDDNVYISDQFTSRIRKVTPDGKISTVAGTGEGDIVGFAGAFGGDGGPATQARLNGQVGLAIDRNGNLFVADRVNFRIRRIDGSTGIITTVAGTGFQGFSGDGGPAIAAALNAPSGIAVDAAGNLYISDTQNQRIRRVSTDGIITTMAGNGTTGFSGDGGQATGAVLNLAFPGTLSIDAAGDLFFVDRNNHRIRKITLSTGVITTVAGTGVAGFNGDGTDPTGTFLNAPSSVAFDAAGNLVIADSNNNRIRRVRPASSVRALATVSAASYVTATGLAAEAIGAAFGVNLATAAAPASTLPLPFALEGTTVRVRDSLSVERLAPLFYVSAGQVNYLIPNGTANGLATITITNGAGEVSTGTVAISTVAPGLFSYNGTGEGVAAASILRIKASGALSYEDLARFDATANRWVATPIDLGAEGDQVFLILYGTGLRNRSALAAVMAAVGASNAEVLYVGPQGAAGLDQINLRLARTLIGAGDVEVKLNVDGRASNAVRVTIR